MKKARAPFFLTLVLLVALLVASPAPVRATDFEVNNTFDDADAHDANPGDCLCADTFGFCTLRAAIEEANACPGADTITFKQVMNISISASNGSLAVSEKVTIDASSVWNTALDVPGVIIDGQAGTFDGLATFADECEIYGLHITNFQGAGLHVSSAHNIIGGGGHQRNVFSGNIWGAVLVDAAAHHNDVRGNYIGLAPNGMTKEPNTFGLRIAEGSNNNTIGGLEASMANVISGNDLIGILIEGLGTDRNWVLRNFVGWSPPAAGVLGNGSHGVQVSDGPKDTDIGGLYGLGNIISGNGGSGALLRMAGSGTLITANTISENFRHGLALKDTADSVIMHNAITANLVHGVEVDGALAVRNLIWQNSIYDNAGLGIHLIFGGNAHVDAPIITQATHSFAHGTGACANCTVAVYSDTGEEGRIYHGITEADVAGNWTYYGLLAGPNICATTIDANANTSEVSTPFTVVKGFRFYVPSAVRGAP